jgi:hypothetical protein
MGELSPSGGGWGRYEERVNVFIFQYVMFPLPLIPSLRGRGNSTFYEVVKFLF